MAFNKIKFTIIGAGSVSFCPATLADILLNERLNAIPLHITLMDIHAETLARSEGFAREAIAASGRNATLDATTCLEKSLEGADFVICAVEKNRYYYWSMDFHIPRR